MSLANTRLLELRVSSPELDKNITRPSRYGAFNVFARGNDEPDSILSQSLRERALTAVGRDVKIPVMDAETITIGSTRSATIADDQNTSQLYNVSFTTYSWGFTQVDAEFDNNEISIQEDFNRKFTKYLNQFMKNLDTAALSALNTNKSQVISDNLGYTVTSNVVLTPDTKKDEILGDITAMMASNDYYNNMHIVGNTGLMAQVQKMAEHGTFNDQNKAIQWLDKEFHFTNRLANDSGHHATGYAVSASQCGVLYRHEAESIRGTRMQDGTEWGIAELPMGLPISTYYYESKGDFNAISGAATAHLTRAFKRHYGYSIDVALITPYNQALATYANPIIRFAIQDPV